MICPYYAAKGQHLYVGYSGGTCCQGCGRKP